MEDIQVVGRIPGTHQFSGSYPLQKLLEIVQSQIPIDKIYAVIPAQDGSVSLREVGALRLEFSPVSPPPFPTNISPKPEHTILHDRVAESASSVAEGGSEASMFPGRGIEAAVVSEVIPEGIEFALPEGRELSPDESLFDKARKFVTGK